jgi:hypothetical protein
MIPVKEPPPTIALSTQRKPAMGDASATLLGGRDVSRFGGALGADAAQAAEQFRAARAPRSSGWVSTTADAQP